MQFALDLWEMARGLVLSYLILPPVNALRLTLSAGTADELADYFLLMFAQLAAVALVFRPLESVVPAEHWPDRKLARVDVTYTLANWFALTPFLTYLALLPVQAGVDEWLGTGDASGKASWHLGVLFPWLAQHSLLLFLIYFVALDFAQWVMHRLQHTLGWWWALHSQHHSQRQMSVWTDDRGNVIDNILQAGFIGAVALVIGVAPVEYGLITFLGKMIENLSHANVRLGFGPVLDKLIVDPIYHRQHHMIADPQSPDLHNCNFAFVFPIWDILFRTALYDGKLRPTGVDDAHIDADNRHGRAGQQLAGARRFVRAVRQGLLRTTGGLQGSSRRDRMS